MSNPGLRPRHLMDPDAPRRPEPSGGMSLTGVQQWVMSALAVTTVLHFVVGLVIAAAYVDGTRAGAEQGLLAIAAVMGLLGVAAGLVIHRRSPLSPWLLLGLLPAAVGAWVIQ